MAAKPNKKTTSAKSKKVSAKTTTKTSKPKKNKDNSESLEDTLEGQIRQGPLRNIMSKAGMERVNEKAFEVVRNHTQKYLTSLLKDAYAFTTADKRTTIGSEDVNKVVEARKYSHTFEDVVKMIDEADEKILFIANANAERTCRKIADSDGFYEGEKKPRFGNDTIKCFRYYLEAELVRLVESVLLVTQHNNRKTIKAEDIELVLRIEERCPKCV